MEILASLGVNQSAVFQFVIFALAFFVMTFGLFTPYAKALHEREERTQGGEAAAEDLQRQTAELRAQFETKARAVNDEIKKIYDQQRSVAQKEFDSIMGAAREQSQTIIDTNRAQVAQQVAEANRKLKEEVPGVAQAMMAKLLSKKA